MNKLIILYVFLMFFSFTALAGDSSGGLPSMNGYSMKSFSGFEKKWKFVTVRYRKDTRELRMIYANPSAWKILDSGKINYPDGAVFAKIAFVTEDDPDFVSSEVPAGTRRYQFMVRDSKKFKETDGWGYMLFDSDGKTFPENHQVQSVACAACHKIVEASRGGVFAQTMDLSPLKKHEQAKKSLPKNFVFETLPLNKFSSLVNKFLPPQVKQLQSLTGDITINLFQGTLDEIKPTLIKEAISSKSPAILYNEKNNRFSLVYLNQDLTTCTGANQHALVSVTTQAPPKEPLVHPFCSE